MPVEHATARNPSQPSNGQGQNPDRVDGDAQLTPPARPDPDVLRQAASSPASSAKHNFAPLTVDIKERLEATQKVDGSGGYVSERHTSSGNDVKFWQEQLKAWAVAQGGEIAAKFQNMIVTDSFATNPMFTDLIKTFQRAMGLQHVDGIIGPRTFRAFAKNYFDAQFGDLEFQRYTGVTILTDDEYGALIAASESSRRSRVSNNFPNIYELSKSACYVAISAEEIAQHLGVSLEQAKNVRAMLGLISWAEGTASERGYGMRFGGDQFDFMEGHPGDAISRGRYTSSACGKYQFKSGIWNGVAGGTMEPKKQDLAAIELIKRRGVLDEVLAGNLDAALPKLAYEWASLPKHAGDTYGGYGQSVKDYSACASLFQQLRSPAEYSGTGVVKFEEPQDIPRMSPLLIATLNKAAAELGFSEIYVSCSITGHGAKTTSGNDSRHMQGHAVDIAKIDGQLCNVSDPEGSEKADRLVAWLKTNGFLPYENGNPRSVLWRFDDQRRGGDHNDHIHVSMRA